MPPTHDEDAAQYVRQLAIQVTRNAPFQLRYIVPPPGTGKRHEANLDLRAPRTYEDRKIIIHVQGNGQSVQISLRLPGETRPVFEYQSHRVLRFNPGQWMQYLANLDREKETESQEREKGRPAGPVPSSGRLGTVPNRKRPVAGGRLSDASGQLPARSPTADQLPAGRSTPEPLT